MKYLMFYTIQYSSKIYLLSVADLHSKILAAPSPPPFGSIFFIFMWFSETFGRIIETFGRIIDYSPPAPPREIPDPPRLSLYNPVTDLNIFDLVFSIDLHIELVSRQCRYRQLHFTLLSSTLLQFKIEYKRLNILCFLFNGFKLKTNQLYFSHCRSCSAFQEM